MSRGRERAGGSDENLLRGDNSNVVSYGTTSQLSPLNSSVGNGDGSRYLSSWQLIGLTIGLAGMQFTWTVEFAYGTPHLISLGLPEFLMSLVWLAGPLSGMIVQPIVGCISDRSTNSYGRRRPVILIGLLFSLFAMFLIAYSREVSSFFVKNPNKEKDWVSISSAVIGFYILDFSINAVQGSLRALILDVAPHQAELANGYASRMIGLGNIIGYCFGFIDLLSLFPWLGNSQMKIICIIASLFFVVGILITCSCVKEVPHCQEDFHDSWITFTVNVFKRIFSAFWKLPSPIQSVCNVQFLAWLSWFPFLFYSTTWMAEILGRTMDITDPDFLTNATQIGSFAFFLYSLISFGSSLILPLLIASENDHNAQLLSQLHNDFDEEPSYPMWCQFKKSLTLRRLYVFSHFLFGGLMLSSGLVSNSSQATAIIALCGISWSIMMWAPFSLISDFANFSPSDSINILQTNEPSHIDSGLVLGIHNLYVVTPQFLVNFLSSFLFFLVQSSKQGINLFLKSNTLTSTPVKPFTFCALLKSLKLFPAQFQALFIYTNSNPEPVGLILRLGGLASIAAGFVAMRIPAPNSLDEHDA